MKLNGLDSPALLPMWHNQTYKGFYIASDAWTNMQPITFFTSSSVARANGNNGGYKSDAYTQKINALALEPDEAKRKQMLSDLNDFMLDEGIVYPIATNSRSAWRPARSGHRPSTHSAVQVHGDLARCLAAKWAVDVIRIDRPGHRLQQRLRRADRQDAGRRLATTSSPRCAASSRATPRRPRSSAPLGSRAGPRPGRAGARRHRRRLGAVGGVERAGVALTAIDVVVNNAGASAVGPLEAFCIEQMAALLN